MEPPKDNDLLTCDFFEGSFEHLEFPIYGRFSEQTGKLAILLVCKYQNKPIVKAFFVLDTGKFTLFNQT